MFVSPVVRVVSLTGLVGMLVLLMTRPASADQNQTPPPPPPPPNQGQGDPGQAGRGGQEPGLRLGRPRSNRPYRGLFGGGVGDMEQVLTLNLNAGGGYDSSVFIDDSANRQIDADGDGVLDPADPELPLEPVRFRRDHSSFGAGSAHVSYNLSRTTFSFWGNGGIGFSYYPVLEDPFMRRYQAETGASWAMSQNASLSGAYATFFGPSHHLIGVQPGGNFDPTLGPSNPFGNALGGEEETYRSETGSVDLSYRLSRRVGVSGRYALWRSVSPTHIYDQITHDAGGRMSYSLSKDLSLFAGYHYSTQRFGSEFNLSPFHTQNIDAGLSFSKALSLTRHTFLSFGTGTAGVSDGSTTRYSITGNVNLTRELGRSWRASASYSRDAQFVETFLQPVFSDAVTGQVSGLINRRVDFSADAYLTYGKVGFGGPSNGFRTFYTTSGVTVAISRYLSGGARYVYSRYTFDQGVIVPRDLRGATDRHGVNAYLSAWTPLFTRARRR